MSDLTFSISNTFSLDERDGALGRNEAVRFYIAPYQNVMLISFIKQGFILSF